MTTETLTLTEFLLARIAEDEAEVGAEIFGHDDSAGPNGIGWAEVGAISEVLISSHRRVLAECEAKRRIVELHESWPVLAETPPNFEQVGSDVSSASFRASQQIQWLTQQEYRKQFGDEPPTTPMLRALAAVYADHPDYREEWRA